MSRWIDADKILPYISRLFGGMPFAVMKMAEIDGIDIVRCKECRYWQDYKGEHFCNNVYGLHEDTNADDFCSYGEREGE